MPDSRRYFVKRGKIDRARNALTRLRGQPADSVYIENELSEIVANEVYERELVPAGSWFSGRANCFKGGLESKV